MEKIFNLLKSHTNTDLLSKAAFLVKEPEANIANAVSSIFAGFLCLMLKDGNAMQIKNILEEAGRLNIASHAEKIFEDNPTQEQQKIGDDFLQHILGDKAADFTAQIASCSGISKVAANRLVSMIAPIFCGVLGFKLIKENWSIPSLLSTIKEQINSFKHEVPSDFIKSFKLVSIVKNSDGNKSGSKWLIWLIVIILVLLLFTLIWRSCGKKNSNIKEEVATVTDLKSTVTVL